MSLSVETDLIIGWADEATEGTDPINSTSATYNEFGNNNMPFKLPRASYQYLKRYYNSRQADAFNLKKIVSSTENIATRPTNGLEWFYLLGLSSSAAGVHTLTPIAEGQSLPFRTVRYESKGGSVSRFVSFVGGKTMNVSETFTFIPHGNTSSIASTIAHKQKLLNADTSLNEAHNGPALPSSISKEYRKDSGMVLTWDGDSIVGSVHQIQITGVNTLLVDQILNSQNANNIYEGALDFAINLKLYRGHLAELFQDMYDQKDTDTGKALVFKIFQVNSSNYKQFTFSDCHIFEPDSPVTPNIGDREPQYPWEDYIIQGNLTNILVKDGVADAFYKD